MKGFRFVALFTVILLSLSSITVNAENNTEYEFRTEESVSNYFTDNEDLQTLLNYCYTFPSGDNYDLSLLYEYISGIDFGEYSPLAICLYDNGGASNISRYRFRIPVVKSEYIENAFLVKQDGNNIGYCVTGLDSDFKDYIGGFFNTSSLSQTPTFTYQDYFYKRLNYSVCYEDYSATIVLQSFVPYYHNNNISSNGYNKITSEGTLNTIDSTDFRNVCYDFNISDLPYEDSNGDIVIPINPEDNVENNTNHLAFNNVDIGFCALNTSNMASIPYYYIKYDVDDWVKDNFTDFALEVSFQFSYNLDYPFGNETLNRTISDSNAYGTNLNLDGFYMNKLNKGTNNNEWFDNGIISVVYGEQYIKDQYSPCVLYAFPIADFQLNRSRYLGSGRGTRAMYNSNGQNINLEPDTDGINYVTYNSYVIRIGVALVDKNTGEKSGYFIRSFNLLNGVSRTEDNSGLTNTDPYSPTDGGSSAIVPSSSELPSGNSNNNNILFNLDGNIGFDPGYEELKNDVESVNPSEFAQLVVPLANSDLNSFVGSTLTIFPQELKTIFVSCFGILCLFGIYRFIRRG